MVKTLQDAVIFCENYPHSEECFNLRKEAFQIELMEQYIESQAHMYDLQATGLLTESVNVMDNLFMEAIGPDQLYILQENAVDKKEGFFRKIKKLIYRIFDWFKSLFNKIKKASDKQEKLLVHARDIVDRQAVAVWFTEVEPSVDPALFQFSVYPKDELGYRFVMRNHMMFAKGKYDANKITAIGAAISRGYVICKEIPASNIVSIWDIAMQVAEGRDVAENRTKLEHLKEYGMMYGCTLSINGGAYEYYINHLNMIQDDIHRYFSRNNNIIYDKHGAYNKGYQDIVITLSDIYSIAGVIIDAYQKFIPAQLKVLTAFADIKAN